MSIQKIAECVEKFAPKTQAQSWDNTGILIDSNTPSTSPRKVLLTIDFTLSVLEECIRNEVKYVLSYHPIIFHGLKQLTNPVLIGCIQNQISVYSPHTQLDPLMNSYIQKILGSNPGTFEDIVGKVKKLSGLDNFRVVRSNDKSKRYKNDGDIIVGVGATFRNVETSNCMIITGEMSHHDLLKCKASSVEVIMMEHSNSERPFLPEFKRLLEEDESLKDFDFFISKADQDPVEYC